MFGVCENWILLWKIIIDDVSSPSLSFILSRINIILRESSVFCINKKENISGIREDIGEEGRDKKECKVNKEEKEWKNEKERNDVRKNEEKIKKKGNSKTQLVIYFPVSSRQMD